MSTNPLLDTTGLPLFDQIKPEHVTPALDVLLADAEAALTKVTGPDVPPDYDALSLLQAPHRSAVLQRLPRVAQRQWLQR